MGWKLCFRRRGVKRRSGLWSPAFLDSGTKIGPPYTFFHVEDLFMSTATADAQPPVTASITRPVLDELDVPLGKGFGA